MPPVRRKLTHEDYLLFPDDGNRHEILDGEHHVTAAPYPRHQSVVVQLTWWIASHLREHRPGRLYVAPVDVLLGRHDIVQPDLLFISNVSMKILTEKNVQGAPDLVIEILSDSTRKRDEGIKLQRYGLLGVQEYWVVDPKRSEARIYRRDGERLRQAAELSGRLPGFFDQPVLSRTGNPALRPLPLDPQRSRPISTVPEPFGPSRKLLDDSKLFRTALRVLDRV